MKSQWAQFAPRTGVVWQPTDKTAIRGGWGVFYDTPQLFFNTRFANNPPWGAQITLTSPSGGLTDPWVGYPGGNPFPALVNGWATQPFPTAGVYVNAPLDTQPTSLQQWNVGVQHQLGDVAADRRATSGNHSTPPVAGDGTELRRLLAGRDHGDDQRAALPGAAQSGLRRVLRHHRTARRHRPRQLQRHAALGAEAV